MPPHACNKCKVGLASESDTWCVGCSSLELAQGLLKQKWHSRGIRQITEECLLSAARLCRAFSNLDRGLAGDAGGSTPGVTPKASAARPRSRSPPREERPPLQRHPRASSPSPCGASPSEESEESWAPEPPPVKREEYVEVQEERHSRREGQVDRRVERGRDRPPPEPDHPPPRRKDYHHEKPKRRKKKKPKRRGGARHQRHYREVTDPLRRSHRRLAGDRLSLAASFKEGLERRA